MQNLDQAQASAKTKSVHSYLSMHSNDAPTSKSTRVPRKKIRNNMLQLYMPIIHAKLQIRILCICSLCICLYNFFNILIIYEPT